MNRCYGEKLLTIATAIAFKLGQDLNADELGIMGDLFSVLGDQLSLLADVREACNLDDNIDF